MHDVIATAFAQQGLLWIVVAVFVAGVVRGFSGFGTAMIYIPIAALFLPPIWVLITLTVMDVFGPLPNLPRAWRDGRPRDVARMGVAMIIMLPVGVAILVAVDPAIFRYGVSGFSMMVPVLLLSGLRFRGEITRGVLYITGAVSGVLGGAVGLPGPPVILLYMSSVLPVQIIRANTMMYLFGFDMVLLIVFAIKGMLSAVPVVLGLIFIVPGVLGNMVGAAMFRPARERVYRGVAYGIVFASAIIGLPIWD